MHIVEKNGEKPPPEKPLLQKLAEAVSAHGSKVLTGETKILVLNIQLGQLDVAKREMPVALTGVIVDVDGDFMLRLHEDTQRLVDTAGRIIVPS